MAMTGVRAVTGGLEIVEEIPPHAIFGWRGGRALNKVRRQRRDAVIELGHWSYGAVGGAIYGLLPATIRHTPWGGPTYGLLLWLGFELAVAPALGVSRTRKTGRRLEALALAADHVLYGLVVAEIRPAHKGMR
jgi:hypothetical protein